MIKIVTVFGTRPEIIKISVLIKELDKNFNHILVNTNQNSDPQLNKIFLKDFGIRDPNYDLNINNQNQTFAISDIMIKIRNVLIKEKPDVFLVYGDTNSAYSCLVAKELKIPIFHMEAGNRSYDQRIPEEINRKIIDHISDVNIVLSEHARNNLLKEGIDSSLILKSGSHMEEVLNKYKLKIKNSKIVSKLNLKKNNFFIASLHRAELVDNIDHVSQVISAFEEIIQIYNIPIVISTHPRLKKKLEEFNLNKKNKKIIFLKPFGFFDYINLCKNSYCVLSDSGSLFEESYLLKFPAVSVRQSHERMEGIETGCVIMSGYETSPIIDAIKIATTSRVNKGFCDYNGGDVSKKITKYIASYYQKINEKIWHKKIR
jgi:UDP-N-acetylglucosamine 2-epimerase (non-hydrolysing)